MVVLDIRTRPDVSLLNLERKYAGREHRGRKRSMLKHFPEDDGIISKIVFIRWLRGVCVASGEILALDRTVDATPQILNHRQVSANHTVTTSIATSLNLRRNYWQPFNCPSVCCRLISCLSFSCLLVFLVLSFSLLLCFMSDKVLLNSCEGYFFLRGGVECPFSLSLSLPVSSSVSTKTLTHVVVAASLPVNCC